MYEYWFALCKRSGTLLELSFSIEDFYESLLVPLLLAIL